MKRIRALFTIAAAAGLAMAMTSPVGASAGASTAALTAHRHVDCSNGRVLCTEVADSDQVFGEGKYVGHDEPSLLFYSNTPGSGNRMRYSGVIPKEPPATAIPGKRSYTFMQGIAFWYGVAMCDTQSYPLTVSTCTPDSDSNIVPASNPRHAGTAFTELQFYPPGYAPWPAGASCSARQWCVALNIDSLSINPVTGEQLNDTCQGRVGIEPVNFAFLTLSGKPAGPPNPVNATADTFTPKPGKTFFLNQGDHYTVTIHDTARGMQTVVADTTTGQSGSMVASAANGFGQVKFAANPSTECTNLPYSFHPMYSTSSPETRVPWAAHSYNVAFDDEIGHFDYCSVVAADGTCTGKEGAAPDTEPADGDDGFCFPAAASTLVKVNGCLGTNSGFDGQSYQPLWPNGDLSMRPSPIIFTSPKTGALYRSAYQQVGFETDLPRIEDPSVSPGNNCNRDTGAGCTRVPLTDDHTPANFYPYFSSGFALGGCAWTIGQDVPGFSRSNYGKTDQYGPLLKLDYIAGPGGATVGRFNDFRRVISNPC